MATVSKSGAPSLATTAPGGNAWVGSGYKAGEAIGAGDPCYINSNGKVYRSVGTTTNAAAKVDGWSAMQSAANEAVTLMTDVDFHYGAAMTPGTRLYVSLTAGVLQDTASAGGTQPVAMALDAKRIRVWQSRY